MQIAATEGIDASPGLGRMPLAQRAATLPGVSEPSSVVRSMHRMARSSAHNFEDASSNRLANDAAGSSAPTSSTLRTPRMSEPICESERAVAIETIVGRGPSPHRRVVSRDEPRPRSDLEREALQEVADFRSPVTRRCRRAGSGPAPGRLVIRSHRSGDVEGVVDRRQRGQAENSLYELEDRGVLVERGLEVARLRPWRNDPGRNPDTEAKRVELWRGHVVEVAARLIVGDDVGGAVPRRRLHQRRYQLLLDAHAHRDVRGRVLIPTSCEARDDEGHLRQPSQSEVVQVLAPASSRALVVGPALPENEDVVGVAERDAVPADVVDLPAHAGCVEQVEDDWVVEYAVAPDSVGRDAAGRAGRDIEAVGPRRPHQRAEVVRTKSEVFEEAVVEGKVRGGVVAHAVDAVGGVEAVHLAGVVFVVRGVPPMPDVGRREAGEWYVATDPPCPSGCE